MSRSGADFIVQVKTRKPWRKIALMVFLVSSITAGGWGLYDYGRYKGGYDSRHARQKVQQLRARTGQLAAENQQLRRRAAALQQGNRVDRYAYKDVSQSLKGLQDEVYELKEEVAFYRTVLEPGKSSKGLRVQSLKMEGIGQQNQYRYKLVLTQVLSKANPVNGAVQVKIYGLQNGSEGTLAWRDLNSDGDKELHFHFKYFQKLEGVISLPVGFKPTRIAVRVIPKGRHRKVINRSFKWNEVEA